MILLQKIGKGDRKPRQKKTREKVRNMWREKGDILTWVGIEMDGIDLPFLLLLLFI
jgi:hypothetical protein